LIAPKRSGHSGWCGPISWRAQSEWEIKAGSKRVSWFVCAQGALELQLNCS
jgi:hypothetical protein